MPQITLYHSPNTRSSGALMLLEELGAPYALQVLDMKAGENRQPAYLAVNPMGKVPAHPRDGALVTEQVAVFLYLADRFPAAGLAPPIGDTQRGPYLRWMAFYAGCFEPAVVDRAAAAPGGRPGDESLMAATTRVMETLRAQLAPGPWLLGERFTAADMLGRRAGLDHDVRGGAEAAGNSPPIPTASPAVPRRSGCGRRMPPGRRAGCGPRRAG